MTLPWSKLSPCTSEAVREKLEMRGRKQTSHVRTWALRECACCPCLARAVISVVPGLRGQRERERATGQLHACTGLSAGAVGPLSFEGWLIRSLLPGMPDFPQGTLYTAVLLAKQQNKWARAVELTLSPSKSNTISPSLSSSMQVNPFGRLSDMKAVVRNITAQVVLKKLANKAPGHYTPSTEMALNELRIARRLNEDGGQKYTVVYIDSMQVSVAAFAHLPSSFFPAWCKKGCEIHAENRRGNETRGLRNVWCGMGWEIVRLLSAGRAGRPVAGAAPRPAQPLRPQSHRVYQLGLLPGASDLQPSQPYAFSSAE